MIGTDVPGDMCPRDARRIAIVTRGCAKNEVDSQAMAEALSDAGHSIVSDPAMADVIIVNTCSFIQSATEESLETIFDLADLPQVVSGQASLVVAGCMPSRYGDDLATELTEARAFVPCSQEDDIVSIVAGLPTAPSDSDTSHRPDSPSSSDWEQDDESSSPYFAYVKISDGCDRWCSYCTIPSIRGPYHSFPYEDILGRVASHVRSGVREIVLIAQDTGRWGQDFDHPLSLSWLIGHLAEQFPDTWFRIMYLQPEGVTDALLDVMATHDNVCSYLDIPLQHVCPPILRAMNRRGDGPSFIALLDHIRDQVPGVTLRTTLIAGFPGETEDQFQELCAFVEDATLDYVGIFPYSREEGTVAFGLPDQVDEDEKQDRAQRLRDIADAVSSARIAQRIGSQVDVLVEGYEEDGQPFGRAQCQAPEVDGVTYLSMGEPGAVVSATIVDTLLYEMEGE